MGGWCKSSLVSDPSKTSATKRVVGNALLASSVEEMQAQYGSLSRSHQNQVLKNIFGKVPQGIPTPCDASGKTFVQALFFDEQFACPAEKRPRVACSLARWTRRSQARVTLFGSLK